LDALPWRILHACEDFSVECTSLATPADDSNATLAVKSQLAAAPFPLMNM